MGRDGWFTLLLSNILILLLGGASLLWSAFGVLRQARNAPHVCAGDVALVLVPGMRLLAGKPNADFRSRLQRARLLHQQGERVILIMGGVTGVEGVSEAAAGRDFLLELSVASSFIQLEDSSRNTLENLRNARERIQESGIERYALLSNRYHLARCQALAHGLGMMPVLCAAEEQFSAPPSSWPRLFLESYYLHWYYTGKLWSRLSRNRHSLSRIS